MSEIEAYQRFVATVRVPATGVETIHRITLALAELAKDLEAARSALPPRCACGNPMSGATSDCAECIATKKEALAALPRVPEPDIHKARWDNYQEGYRDGYEQREHEERAARVGAEAPCIFHSFEGVASCGTHRETLTHTKTGWLCQTSGVTFPYGTPFGTKLAAMPIRTNT